MPQVVIYSSRMCGYCHRAKQLLDRKGVPFQEFMVDQDPALREAMMQKSGRRTVPQIFIGDVHVGGCDDLYALDRTGGLDELLASSHT